MRLDSSPSAASPRPGLARRRFIAWLALALPLFLSTLAAAAAPESGPSTRPAPYEKEIEAFEAADRKAPPQPGGIIFLGSSSIRKWTTLAEDFPGLPVLNRGFGGSHIPDSTRYAARIVVPHKPRLIVFYAGDNDLASGRTPEQVLSDFKALVAEIHGLLPQTKILFVSIKPSPSRAKLMGKMKEANRLIREFIEQDEKAKETLAYIDVATPMLGEDGQARPELFGPDNLHMNRKGYELWTSIIGPKLK